jgi:rubrerythrin
LEMSTVQKLQLYIKAELGDAALYRELAKIAPNEDDRQLLLEFAEDEQSHANEFQRIYRTMTGRSYNPIIEPPVLQGTFNEILRERVIDESGDFRKYGQQYIQTDQNSVLKEAYYRARTDENVHALRLLYMLSK